MVFQVPGDPHPWPRRPAPPETGAVIVVDMQHDYCSPGFYIHQAGYDPARLSAPIEPVQRVLAAARRRGLAVVYTQHSRRPEAAPDPDFPATAAVGEPGWEIVPALTPQPGDRVIAKSTINAFVSGELDRYLRSRGIRHLAFCGNTIDVCVHSSLRAAVDLDYECVLLADGCGAVNAGLHAWALESVKVEAGVFGTVATSAAFTAALAAG